jgi:glycosyltransferase involved in cell wall biosynthesis
MTSNGVVMIGSFPPPVGGAALINQMMLDTLRDRNVDVAALDVSGPALAHSRSVSYHARRIAANLRACRGGRRLARRGNALYLVPDAGAGAWYTAGLARTVAGGYDHVVIHHHSCRYIEEHSRPIAMLTEHTRGRATHVFLTKGMGAAFGKRYGSIRQHVATNARFVSDEAQSPPAPRPEGALRLGHLSNLCAEKGFFTVADSFDALRDAGYDVTLHLAGPVLEEKVIARLAALRDRHGARIAYDGSVKGDAKRDFYRGIDLFLFPTEWRQEAAPLVIYEAFAAGVPVLTNDRGVIPELMEDGLGAVCPADASFSAMVAEWIDQHSNGPDRQAQAQTVKQRIRTACVQSERQYEELLTLLAKHSGTL